MGTYTGLRFRAVIKKEFCAIAEEMTKRGIDWGHVARAYDHNEFFKAYEKVSRRDLIPHGPLCYMPTAWEKRMRDPKSNRILDLFDHTFDEETRVWQFQCSLKNYEDTIAAFFEHIVPHICEKVHHLETYYEYADKSEFYELQKGKVVPSKREGIAYYLLESLDLEMYEF